MRKELSSELQPPPPPEGATWSSNVIKGFKNKSDKK
jgi:hypothetical protein